MIRPVGGTRSGPGQAADLIALLAIILVMAWRRRIRRPHARRCAISSPGATGDLAPQAVERLLDDWDPLVTFYQFPQAHWRHLRTMNVVESPFAAVRLQTTAAKRSKKVTSTTTLIWKLLQVAEKTFRRLNTPELLHLVYTVVKYLDGERVKNWGPEALAA